MGIERHYLLTKRILCKELRNIHMPNCDELIKRVYHTKNIGIISFELSAFDVFKHYDDSRLAAYDYLRNNY